MVLSGSSETNHCSSPKEEAKDTAPLCLWIEKGAVLQLLEQHLVRRYIVVISLLLKPSFLFNNSQPTTHKSQLTTHNSQLTTHNSQLYNNEQRRLPKKQGFVKTRCSSVQEDHYITTNSSTLKIYIRGYIVVISLLYSLCFFSLVFLFQEWCSSVQKEQEEQHNYWNKKTMPNNSSTLKNSLLYRCHIVVSCQLWAVSCELWVAKCELFIVI